MHKTIGYKKKYTRYDEKNKIRRKSKKYLGQFLTGRNVKKLEDAKEELERLYGAKNFLKKYLHIIHGRCIIMQVKHGECIFIHSISGNTLHPD